MGVVDEQRVLADVRDIDDLQVAVGAARDAAARRAVDSEADRLAVHEADLVDLARVSCRVSASNAPSLKTGQFW